MFPHVLPFAGDVDARQALDSIKTVEIAWIRVHAIVNRAHAQLEDFFRLGSGVFFVLPCAELAATWLPRPVSCCRGVHVAASSGR